MILRMIWPGWALLLVFGSLLALCAWAWWRSRGDRAGADWLRRAAMVCCALVIGLGPAVPASTEQVATNAEVFFVVDRTGSMAAEDHADAEPRLAGVRQDVTALVEALPGARYSVISFHSQATRQLPLTGDAGAVRAWAETLVQEITRYSAGSRVDRPLEELTEALTGARERNPQNVRLVFLLSDGENTEDAPATGDDAPAEPRSFAPLAPLVDGGAVLGYGTADGGRMRSYDGTADSGPGTDAPYITDPERPGSPPAVSRIDETTLRRIADQLGVPYVHRTGLDPVDELVAGIDVEEIAADGRRTVQVHRDVGWPVALVLALLVAWEAYVQAVRAARLRWVVR